jgi:hypothetical protein
MRTDYHVTLSIRRTERWQSGRMRIIANDVTPEMGSQGSNPCLSASIIDSKAHGNLRELFLFARRRTQARTPEMPPVGRRSRLVAYSCPLASLCSRRHYFRRIPVAAAREGSSNLSVTVRINVISDFNHAAKLRQTSGLVATVDDSRNHENFEILRLV